MSEQKSKYGHLTLNWFEDIINRLGGEEGAERFKRGELVLVPATKRELKVWKTVKLGVHKTADGYREALKKAGRKIGDWANDILGKPQFTCAQEETDVDLVMLTVAELGFKDGARYADICARALSWGLELCPAEVGPALRLQYGDQPRDEWVRVGMEAITDSDGYLSIFAVFCGNVGLWLDGFDGHPDSVCSAVNRFVFVRRK